MVEDYEFQVERDAWQSTWYEILGKAFAEELAGEYENDVFVLRPFWWGDCTCGNEVDSEGEYIEDPDMKPCGEDCKTAAPNFHYKPTGYKLRWYKYPLRSASANQKISFGEWLDMLRHCANSVKERE